MSKFDLKDLERRMQGALNVLKQEFSGLRTGRANASLLDPITVDAYGTPMPLNQLATITVPEPRMISVQVWDKGQVQAVEKAISLGRISRPTACEMCGGERALQGHHDSYDKEDRLRVVWLCNGCHRWTHDKRSGR